MSRRGRRPRPAPVDPAAVAELEALLASRPDLATGGQDLRTRAEAFARGGISPAQLASLLAATPRVNKSTDPA